MREYAIYHGDTFIDIGTAQELSRKHNYKINTIYKAVTWQTKRVKADGKGLIAVLIKWDEEEEND